MILINRNKCPEPNGTIDFSLPEINRFKLLDRLPVYFIPKKNLPIVQLGILINAGSKNDKADKFGMAKLTSMVVDEGAGKYSALELDSEFESLGTVFNISADKDSTIITLLSLRENFERSVELLSEILKNPHFNKNDFDREKKKLLTQLQQFQDKPQYLAHTSFEKMIFENSNYANPVSGNFGSLNNISLSDAKYFYSNYYGINNSELIAVGDITQNELSKILLNHLSDWKEIEPGKLEAPKLSVNNENIFVIHRDNSPQTEIQLGHYSTGRESPDFFAKSLMNTILGGQFTSRINLNLRENKGFTYGAHSTFSYFKPFGQFYVSTSVKAENTGESIKEILNEIRNIQMNVSAEEIDFAKSYLIKRFPSQFETYSQLVHNLALLSVHSLPDDYFNHYVNNIQKVTKEDVLAAALNNLHTNNLTIVLVGDKSIIAPQLNKSFIELDLNGDVIA